MALNLVEGRLPLLPGWNSWSGFLADGVMASAVILLHLLPFFGLYWGFALQTQGGSGLLRHRAETDFFLGCVLLLPPLIPVVVVGYAMLPWIHITVLQASGLFALFALTAFILPAAFRCVSLYGRFTAALRPDRSLHLIVRDSGSYLWGWRIALEATWRGMMRRRSGLFWS